MTRFAKNIICSMSLAASDFISFVFSLYLSLAILSVTLMDFENRVPENQIESWATLHWLLGLCCVAWYGIRLRHYFYRKTFWYELKEILRTLVIFAVIEMAVMAFAKWYFSRYVWLLTWVLAAT
ncbi:TPA: UDP-phosphate galactose phosphotransferase, partial [Escherichia coli]